MGLTLSLIQGSRPSTNLTLSIWFDIIGLPSLSRHLIWYCSGPCAYWLTGTLIPSCAWWYPRYCLQRTSSLILGMILDLRKHKKLWIFLFFLLVVSTKWSYHTPAAAVIQKLAVSRASSLLISYSCYFSHWLISWTYWSKVIGSLHFSALPLQFSGSLIFANLLGLLVLAELLLCFWPVILSHSGIKGVISLTLPSDSSAAVSLSGVFPEPDLSASLSASDPPELESWSGSSSEGFLVLPAFLLAPVLLQLLQILSESCNQFSFWVCFWLLSFVGVWFLSSALYV